VDDRRPLLPIDPGTPTLQRAADEISQIAGLPPAGICACGNSNSLTNHMTFCRLNELRLPQTVSIASSPGNRSALDLDRNHIREMTTALKCSLLEEGNWKVGR
jgi:hypothetical protein